MTRPDQDYFRKREQQERDSAERSDDLIAKRVHLEMAERYSAMASQQVTIPPAPQA